MLCFLQHVGLCYTYPECRLSYTWSLAPCIIPACLACALAARRHVHAFMAFF
jgi:hypothetical protein